LREKLKDLMKEHIPDNSPEKQAYPAD